MSDWSSYVCSSELKLSGIIRRFVADGAGVVRAVAHRGGENHDRPLRATGINKGQVLQRSGVADRMLGRLLPPMVPLARLERALPCGKQILSLGNNPL